MKNYIVNHSSYGTGTVISIYGSRIDIDFSGRIVSMVFPGAFYTGLSTVDVELQDIAQKALAKVTKQTHSSNSNTSTKTDVLKIISDFQFDFIRDRCKSLDFTTNEELFEAIGYLTKPNVLHGIWAEIPQSACSEFKSVFPEETIMPITKGVTEQGMSNKFGVQCRLNLSDVTNCPDIIKYRLSKGLGKTIVNRLNCTRFALQMVKFFGFHFGNQKQDFSSIYSIAEDYGYGDSFMKGYNL